MEEKERRPMNGFMLFAKRKRIELTQKFPGKDNRWVECICGDYIMLLPEGGADSVGHTEVYN